MMVVTEAEWAGLEPLTATHYTGVRTKLTVLLAAREPGAGLCEAAPYP
ncbi:hypothetical protein OCOJLMKI_3277 [Methylobacterium iners]|uniref:Transposase n=1 Tax=Methylobacterium iners TaxID=418707 RepID=A0ABQ4S2B5_9HYPH|nr:hypothetical protein OCOJLMKI_3277 [Methylobacterium iners]